MLVRFFFSILLMFSQNLWGQETIRIEVRNPEHYNIRRLTESNLLVGAWESMPDTIQFDVPARYIVRGAGGRVLLEPTLEVWRAESGGGAGNPLIHPPLGTCNYSFPGSPGSPGCDFYPFQNSQGETRYVALRYMAREGENSALGDSDIRYETQEIRDAEGNVVGTDRVPVYNRSRFYMINSDGTEVELAKPVDLTSGTRPDPILTTADRRDFVRDEDDLTGVPSGRLNCSSNTGDPFQCLMCNCHHESNVVYENGQNRIIGYEGRFAVAATVKTRMGMDSYPDSICDVVWFQGRTQSGRMVAHYTWTLDGEGEEIVEGQNYQRCYQPVRDVLEGLNEHFASHYHTPGVTPGWQCFDASGNPSQGRYIDGHIFYDTCDRRDRATPEDMGPIEVSQ